MVKELDGVTYEEWLSILGLFSLEKSHALIAVYNFHMKGRGEGSADLFSLVSRDRT